MASSINDQILKDKLNNTQNLPCNDFLAFQDLLLRSRKIDDNITNLINTTIPTDSFVCEKNDPTKQVRRRFFEFWNSEFQIRFELCLNINSC